MQTLSAALVSIALVAPVAAAGAADAAASAPAITVTKAKKLAKAGVLTAADMPGFVRERIPRDPTDAADERALFSCLGSERPKYAARNHGFSYTKLPLSIDSTADVVATVAAAKADMKAFRSAKMPGCLKTLYKTSLERQGAQVRSLSLTKVAATVANADAAVVYRYRVVAQAGDILLQFIGYEISARVGQTEIGVGPGTINAPGPGLKKALALAGILADRVRAAG